MKRNASFPRRGTSALLSLRGCARLLWKKKRNKRETVSSLPALRSMCVNKSRGTTESRAQIGFPGAALLPEETSRFD